MPVVVVDLTDALCASLGGTGNFTNGSSPSSGLPFKGDAPVILARGGVWGTSSIVGGVVALLLAL